MRYILTIDEDQTIAVHKVNDVTIPLDLIKKHVKGLFEVTGITPFVNFPIKEAVMLVNDSGCLEAMEPNLIASILYWHQILGPVMLCKIGYAEDGPFIDIISLTYEDIEAIRKWAKE